MLFELQLEIEKKTAFLAGIPFHFRPFIFHWPLVANWTRSELTRSKCEWSRIWTIYNVDETNSRLVCPCSLACNKFSNHKFIINKHALVSWGLLSNKLQFCLLIRNETSIKKNFHIKCNKMTHRQKITNNNGILLPKLFWPTVRIFWDH